MANKVMLSLGKKKKLYGYEIERMPLGTFLLVMAELKDFPEEISKICFQDLPLSEIAEKLKNFDDKMLKDMFMAVFQVFPEYIIKAVALLSGIDENELINNKNIGLTGLFEITEAVIEVNNLGKCILSGRRLKKKMKALKETKIFGFSV